MSKPLGLLMKEHFKFPCLGSTLKVCIVLIVLTFVTSLECCGGGGGGWSSREPRLNETRNDTDHPMANRVDDLLLVNLTGIKDPVDRNAKTAWYGWEPSEMTKKEWKDWHEKFLKENAKNGEVPWKLTKSKKKGKGEPQEYDDGPYVPGQPGAQNFSAERGPGSGWPNLPGWADLGAGSDGTPIPPWAYVPKNIGKPSICYLPPLEGKCWGTGFKPEVRWGFNPYVDECQKYQWSTCGGTRNRFATKEACEKMCAVPPPPSCSVDSGILDKSSKP